MKENNQEKRFTLRMDAELFKTIKQLAEQNKRSIAKQIEYMLSQELQANPNTNINGNELGI